MEQETMLKVARGIFPADLVLKHARIVNVFTEEVIQGDIAVQNGRIAGIGNYQGRKEVDLSGKYVCPGFMDGHMHFESSLIAPFEYERAVLPRGTTAVMADPHEIANVAGVAGIEFMLSAAEQLTMHARFNLPSCVPSSVFEESGAELKADSLCSYYNRKQVLGLAEVMDVPGLLLAKRSLLDKIRDAQCLGRNIDGHGPGLTGKDLCAYVAAGV